MSSYSSPDIEVAPFSNPWKDVAGQYMPTTLEEMYSWAECVWFTNGTYSSALNRVVSYFITSLDIKCKNGEMVGKYRDYFEKQLNYVDCLKRLGLEFCVYGESFSSLSRPFRRFFICKACRSDFMAANADDYRLNAASMEFSGTCPICKAKTTFERRDRSRPNEDMRLIFWPGRDIQLLHNPVTDDKEIWIRPHTKLVARLKTGSRFHLETTPWEVLDCAIKNNWLIANDNMICHIFEPTLSGVYMGGRGMSPVVSNVRQAFYNQTLMKFNEVLAMDYIIPQRIISPAADVSGRDPNASMDMRLFREEVKNIAKSHRRDPASFHISPVPLNYQVLGGEGMQMTAFELIDNSTRSMLNAIGIPAELYQGTLQVQAAPTALRLFGRTWTSLVSAYNRWLNWAAKRISEIQNWEPAEVSLTEVTLADDIERRQILLQLLGGQLVSQRTALGSLGLDPIKEQKAIADEQQAINAQAKDMQVDEEKRMALEQQLNAMLGGGGTQQSPMPGATGGQVMPLAAGGTGQVTAQDMLTEAQATAQQLLTMDETSRRRALDQIKQTNPTMHANVRVAMETMRNQQNQDAGDMARAQQAQQPM